MNDELEQRLRGLREVQPASGFEQRMLERLQQAVQPRPRFRAAWALAALLLLSLALNAVLLKEGRSKAPADPPGVVERQPALQEMHVGMVPGAPPTPVRIVVEI